MSALLDAVSPVTVRGVGALAGGLLGVIAARLADVLPRRYGITHLVEGRARTLRNVAVVALSIAIGAWFGHLVTRVPDVSVGRALFYFSVNATLAIALVAAAAVDLEHMILPNELTLGGALLALVSSTWRGVGLVGSLVGIVVGLALTYLPFILYKKLRGRSGMGLGDAKLALFAGAWLGGPGAIFVVFAGALQSALCAIIMRVLGVSFAVPASVQAELDDLRARAAAGDEEARELLADDPMAADVTAPTTSPSTPSPSTPSPSTPSDGETAEPSAASEAAPGQPPSVSASSPRATMRLPMGPFLVLACLEFVFARRQILELFDRYIAPP
jgi:leader peptidase (prepilin peptidase)/N-methyltransferase